MRWRFVRACPLLHEEVISARLESQLNYILSYHFLSMLSGSLVTTAWRVLRLWMEGRLPGTEGSCEYTE
jgi:hypothetical protein